VSQSFSLFSVTPVVSLFSVIPSFLSVIPSVLSHSLYSQSFLLFSVILSFLSHSRSLSILSHSFLSLSHSFCSQSFLIFSVIPSFLSVIPSILSHSLYSQSFLLFSVILVLSSVIPSFSVIPPARPHLSAPSSSFFPGAQRLPKSPAAVIQPGPARQCGPLPYKKVPRPRTLNLAAAAPLETRSAAASFFLRRATPSASPWSGRSAVPQTATTSAPGSPRHPEAPRA
jgi:hypothetical protein